MSDARRFAQEQAEAKKRAELVVAIENGNEEAFWPVGGHAKPNSPVAFYLYVDNLGDSPAEDVTAYIGLPPWAHPAPYSLPSYVDQTVAMSASMPILFDTNLLHPELGQPVGVAHIERLVYPKPRRHPIGLLSVNLPSGLHKFKWVIESSAGQFRSNDTNAISIDIHDTAIGHDIIRNYNGNTEGCRYCTSLKRFPSWISQVQNSLEKHRRMNGDRSGKLHLVQGGLQAQWC